MMKPVPIEVRLPSASASPPLASAVSPRTCTTVARARSARSANAEIAGLCLGALVQSDASRSAAPEGEGADPAQTMTAMPAAAVGAILRRRIDEAYAIGGGPDP